MKALHWFPTSIPGFSLNKGTKALELMIAFILYTRELSKQVVDNFTIFNLQSSHLYTIYSLISVQGVAVKGPEASNRFLSVKCKQ